jgi:hypothetical protein
VGTDNNWKADYFYENLPAEAGFFAPEGLNAEILIF